jgi:hypothetical protein
MLKENARDIVEGFNEASLIRGSKTTIGGKPFNVSHREGSWELSHPDHDYTVVVSKTSSADARRQSSRAPEHRWQVFKRGHDGAVGSGTSPAGSVLPNVERHLK